MGKLTEAQRRSLNERIQRWLADELWIAKTLGDNAEFSNKTEMLRSLGSAIAYGQREVAGRAALKESKP